MKKVNIIMRCIEKDVWLATVGKNFKQKEIKIVDCGYLQFDDSVDISKEEIWHWCNWSCWSQKKPKECKHLNITHCNSDMAYCIDDVWYSHDEKMYKSFDSCLTDMKNIRSNTYHCFWPKQNNKLKEL